MPIGTTSTLPSPLPKSPYREKFDQQLTAATEGNYLIPSDDERQVLRGRLNQGWQNAVARFKADTGKDLGDFRGGKNGVLGTLRKRYAEDNEDTKKKDELWAVVDKALSCVDFIGKIAAQVGSMVFSPANLCFSALETLINIPQAFKKLRDSLHGLFNQIVNFLANFQILERVDNQLGLDNALVEKTNEVLVAVVDICRLSHDASYHKILTVMGNVFLKDDKVKGALDKFRGLIEEQNKLTSTITLEAALRTRATTQIIDRTVSRIGDDVNGISVKIDTIQAFQSDDKNIKANQEKIADIDSALGLTEATVREPLRSLEQCRNTMLDSTMEIFRKDDSYIDWSRSKAHRKLLCLQGDKGSGRTYLLAALNRQIDSERMYLAKDDHKIYVAYYAFRREEGTIGTNSWTPLRTALGVMASQIARQSNTYTETLHKSLTTVKDARELEDFWRALKLDDFTAPDNSILYLFFDGLEQLKTSLRNLKKAIDPAISANDRPMGTRRRLRLRVVFTGNKETLDNFGQEMPTIEVRKLNEPLLRRFVEHEMEIMLREGSISKQSGTLTEAILKHTAGSFTGVLQRLDMIKNAVSADVDFEMLLEQIQSNKDSNSLLIGAEILEKVCSNLSSEHQQQLKETLYWAVFGLSWVTVEELEVALFLRRQKEFLEPLDSKIKVRFAPAVIISDGKVVANGDDEQYVEDANVSSAGPAGSSRITLDVKIENVDETLMKQFFWDLNNAIATERFDFASGLKQSRKASKEPLRFSFSEAHYIIAIRCLQALNDDKLRSKTEPLLQYACRHLPDHMYYLKSQNCYELLSPGQRRALGQGIVGFFADMECINSVWDSNPLWDRRMAEKMTKQTLENPVPFLEPLALAAASRWLDRGKAVEDQELVCFHNVNAYLRLHENPDSVRFRPKEDESAADASIGNDSSTDTAVAVLIPEKGAEEELPISRRVTEEVTTAQDETGDQRPDIPNPDANTSEKANSIQSNNGMNEDSITATKSNEDAHLNASEEHNDGGPDTDSVPKDNVALEPEVITGERVKEALDWSLKHLGLETDFFVFQRLGRTLMYSDGPAAIAYLKQAYETAPAGNLSGRVKAACALADAYAENDTVEAYNTLIPMIEESRSLRAETTLSENEKSQLFDMLTKAATYLLDKKDDAGAIRILEDALAYSPTDGQCRHDLIRLLCKTDQATRAQELFDQWMHISTQNRNHRPQAHFLKVVRGGEYIALSSFFHSTWQSPLYTRIMQALTVAIEYEGDDSEYSDKSALHFARGLALAVTKQDEGLQTAVREWRACINKHASTRVDHKHILSRSWSYASQYYFDLYRSQLLEHPQMPITDKIALWTRLQDFVEGMQVQEDNTSTTYTPLTYVAAFAKLAGLDKDAKDVLRSDMARAIRILRDDDPENDNYGLLSLILILRCYGDIQNLCNAWSFFDREKLASKREKRWNAQLAIGDLEINKNETLQQPDPRPDVTVNLSEGERTTTSSSSGAMSYDCSCDGCSLKMPSCEEQEVWTCTFCPILEFCGACYKKLKNKELDRVVCSHDHVHVRMMHLDYDREEVEGQNVRVGWRFTDSTTRQREGGKIVELKDWVDMLADEWDIGRTD